MKIESVERGIIFGCLFLLCLLAFHSLIYLSFLHSISKILIVEISLLLVLVCLLGCSVYHVQMWRDANSGTSLLNNLYTITAVIMQVQSVLLCAQIFEDIFGQNNQYLNSFVKNTLLLSRVFNFFHIISLTILNVCRQYKPSKYLDISVDPRGKWIIFSIEFLLTFSYFIVQIWNGCFDSVWNLLSGCMTERLLIIIAPTVLIICSLLLLKVAEDGYGLWKRTRKASLCFNRRVASFFRLVSGYCFNQNLVTPFNEELDNDQSYQFNIEQVKKQDKVFKAPMVRWLAKRE